MKLSFSVLLVCTSLILSTQNAASADPIYNFSINTATVVHQVDPYFRSVTIDTTNNRQFFQVNWSDPNLISYMKALGPMNVRIGGSGEGQDNLLFTGARCTQTQGCIDEVLFDQIYNIVVKTGGNNMVWGLSYPKFPNNTFNPSQAAGLMAYASSKGYTIFGFELGNEDFPQIDDYPEIYAADFGRLKNLIAQYWPNPANQPLLIGPDNIEGADWNTQRLLQQFIEQDIPMHAITSHEYYGMNDQSYLNGQRLDGGIATSSNWTGTLAQWYGPIGSPGVPQMWAGETGPSIGGSGNCSEVDHRFNIFADGFWYLDSLATHALYGYSVFCRQDFYGIDYALIHCAWKIPVPDFYLALAWNKVVGTKVLNATRPVTNPQGSVRPYAHCSKEFSGGLTVMLINVFGFEVQVTLTNPVVGTSRQDYLFTSVNPTPNASYPYGIYGYWAELNGNFLNVTSTGALPANLITPLVRTGAGLNTITLPAYSYGYFVYPNANLAVCAGSGTLSSSSSPVASSPHASSSSPHASSSSSTAVASSSGVASASSSEIQGSSGAGLGTACTIYFGYDTQGHDINSSHILSYQNCCALCQQTTICGAWAWNHNTCYLKTPGGALVVDSGAVSGTIPGVSPANFLQTAETTQSETQTATGIAPQTPEPYAKARKRLVSRLLGEKNEAGQ